MESLNISLQITYAILVVAFVVVMLLAVCIVLAVIGGALAVGISGDSDESKKDRAFLAAVKHVRYDPEDPDFAVGVKFAMLLYDPGGRSVCLHATAWSVTYPATNARAICTQETHAVPLHTESAPREDCKCGFYIALDAKALLEWSTVRRNLECLLEVRASGRVIEHERGIRAERQDVLKVWLRPFCSECNSKATTAAVWGVRTMDNGDTPYIRELPTGIIRPLCDRCSEVNADKLMLTLSVGQLAQLLQTEVEWA